MKFREYVLKESNDQFDEVDEEHPIHPDDSELIDTLIKGTKITASGTENCYTVIGKDLEICAILEQGSVMREVRKQSEEHSGNTFHSFKEAFESIK